MACVIIGSDNAMEFLRRQAYTSANTWRLSFEPLGIDFRETWIEMQNVWFKRMHSKISSAKRGPFCADLIHTRRYALPDMKIGHAWAGEVSQSIEAWLP